MRVKLHTAEIFTARLNEIARLLAEQVADDTMQVDRPLDTFRGLYYIESIETNKARSAK